MADAPCLSMNQRKMGGRLHGEVLEGISIRFLRKNREEHLKPGGCRLAPGPWSLSQGPPGAPQLSTPPLSLPRFRSLPASASSTKANTSCSTRAERRALPGACGDVTLKPVSALGAPGLRYGNPWPGSAHRTLTAGLLPAAGRGSEGSGVTQHPSQGVGLGTAPGTRRGLEVGGGCQFPWEGYGRAGLSLGAPTRPTPLEGAAGVGEPRERPPRTPQRNHAALSPQLVRKKAIRSKVLAPGAYRACTYETQLQLSGREAHEVCRDVHRRGLGRGGGPGGGSAGCDCRRLWMPGLRRSRMCSGLSAQVLLAGHCHSC